MSSSFTLKLLLLLLLSNGSLFAVDGKVRAFIKSDGKVYTSQKVTVAVELLTDALSITEVKIRFPNSQRYIVQAPQSAAALGREEINGTDWQIVRYEYALYPLRAGEIEIPAIPVSFTASMGYGQPKKRFDLKSGPLRFKVAAPKGVEKGQFVLVTDKYRVRARLQPEKTRLIVGDAVTLTLTQQAAGVPDILLPPIVYRSNTFIRVYGKEPILKNGLKVEYDVSRMDSFTLVAGKEGNVTLPAWEFLWWDPQSGKLHREKVPAITFEIVPDPQVAIEARKAVQQKMLLYMLGILILLIMATWRYAPKVHRYIAARRRRYKESEAGHFQALLGCEDAAACYKHFYAWLQRVDPSLARGGLRAVSKLQPSFEASLRQLEAALGNRGEEFDTIAFMNEAKRLRATLLSGRNSTALPSCLNPQ